MKTTTKLLAGAVAVAIGGLAMTNMASATTTVTPVEGETVSYTLNGNENFTAGVLEISGDDTKIWILDRNLGATAAGTGCEDPSWGSACAGGDATYGYHFQWGNNYGFDPNSTPATGGQKQTPITYNPFYTDPVFRIGIANRLNDDSVVDLWGGSTADNTYSVNDETWKVSNATARQGPCPEGFHVPSRGELAKIKNMMGDDASAIHSQLLVPFAGFRGSNDAGVYDLGGYAILRSSSPTSTESLSSRRLYLSVDGDLRMDLSSRAAADSLRCVYDSYETYTPSGNLSSETGPSTAQIILSVAKGILRIGNTDSILNLGEVNVSNNAQLLSGSFGANSFWVEDMKGVESGYYTTIQVTDLTGTVAGHIISASNVSLKTENAIPSYISGAAVDDAKVIFGEGITNWHSGSGAVNYFMRENTSTANAGRVGKWGDNLQIKVNIPAHTPYDTYRGTITYTLYDLDS